MTQEVFVFPLSFGQERIWFMDQLSPGNPMFNLSTALRLSTPIRVPDLERSLNEIVRRHESLRTSFMVVDERPVQIIAPSLNLALSVTDLSGLRLAEREKEALRLANEEALRPFDLARAPLVRTSLLRLAPQEHVFVLTMHHIVSDGWSLGIFWKELSVVWAAFALGKPSPLPDLPIHYADFTVWQRDWLQGDVFHSQLAYWKRQLVDLSVLELPTDRPRPAIQTFRGARHPLALPPPLAAALRTLSQHEEVTLFMTLLAAFQALLHRYTGQEDIVVGSYIAGRNRTETEGLIGFFLNSLVLRTAVSGQHTFRELLREVKKMTLDAYAHQDLPFSRLVEELQPERDLSRNPLFQVMFQLLNVPTLSQIAAVSKPQLLELSEVTSVFDLSCMLAESGDGLRGHLEYSTDLFDSSSMARMAGHYQALLEGIVSDPDQRISSLPLLIESERQQLLSWNFTARAYLEDQTLTQIFEAETSQHPDATAFISDGKRLTYRELNRRANQLGHYLRTLDVGPEVLVGICMDRCFDFVVSLLAVLKAGGAYLGLDPIYPRERLSFVLRDAGVSLLLTLEKFITVVPAHDVRAVCLDLDEDAISRQSESNPISLLTPAHLAYVIYTSGSTGVPKGVAVDHKQLLNRFTWMWEAYPFEAGEVSCQKTALNFVDSIWELFGPLLKGVPTVLVPDHVVLDPYALVQTLADHRVSRIWLVPSLLRMILRTCLDLNIRLPALKFWVSSGEPLPIDLFEEFKEVLPESTLFNLYGTSEVWDVTWYDPRSRQDKLWRVPIGRPINNMQVYVLDSNLQQVPIGVAGELYVGGIGLARGYLNRPELNAEKFIPNAYSSEPGARLYKTGDLARFLPDGNLEYLGRLDHQTKLRGFRIELEEIEAVLRQHGSVQEAVVIVREDELDDKRLIGYLVARQGERVAGTELRAFLREKLPEYMVPGLFVRLESLPLTPSGKVNRSALPKPEAMDSEMNAGYVAPQTDVERVIVGIWQQILRTDRVSTHENFFDLGGHSLLMFQVHSRLRQTFGRRLSMTDLFRYPTVQSLAKYFTEAESTGPSLQRVRDRAARQKEAIGRPEYEQSAEPK